MTTRAQQAAQARYDKKRPPLVAGRLAPEERAKLESQKRAGETDFRCLVRLAGLST